MIFVSHNLRAVAEICSRSLLLERGRVRAIGDTTEVIQTYLDHMSGKRVIPADQPAHISSVVVRGIGGETVTFDSGEKAWIDVTIQARGQCDNFAVALDIQNDQFEIIYDTSSQQLGENPISLSAGQVLTATFELTINMAFGTFHVSTYIHRFDIQKAIDAWSPSATIYVSTPQAVRGAVNCFAKVVDQRVD